MVSKAQKIRLGLFMTVGIFIILITIATLSYDQLFDTKDIYYIAYTDQSLSGIEIGSRVKYLGIPVGSVRDLHINPDNYNQIIVTIAIDPETPVREDVTADLMMVGITGIKEIELTAGSSDAAFLEPESFIQPGTSITDEFVDQARQIAHKVDLVLDNMLEFTQDDTRTQLLSFIDEAQGTIVRVNKLIDDNQERMERTVSNVDTLTTELNKIVGSLNAVLNQTDDILVKNRGTINRTVEDLNITVQYLNEPARTIKSDPSILLRGRRMNNIPDDRLDD